MRGVISEKLSDFINQANAIAAQAKADGVQYSTELVRDNIEKLSVFIGQGPELDYVEESSLITPTHNIDVRIYSPAPKQKLPVVLHYHGGGHMCGNIALYDTISRKISKAGHCIVIAVEYRLAPEFPYPAGIDDCQYALAHYKSLLTNISYSEELIVAGDSGGGAICTTLTSNNINNANIKINKQVLIYPSVDYTMSSASVVENGTGFLLEQAKISWYFEQYFQDKQDQNKKHDDNDVQHDNLRRKASPLFMPMSFNMPKTLVFIAGCDPLRDEGLAYSEALSELGVTVEQHTFDGLIHAYMLLDSVIDQECEQTYQLIGDFIRS